MIASAPAPAADAGAGDAGVFPALGTTAVVRTADPAGLALAVRVVNGEIEAMDRAASRFRADSELMTLRSGRRVAVSPTLGEALATARYAAELTGGLVDPTLGTQLSQWGYDRDFADISPDGPPVVVQIGRRAAWRDLLVEADHRHAVVPAGVTMDLGATAKALCADRAAKAAAAATGCGVLVALGGDVAMSGPAPIGGWHVRVTADRDHPDTVAAHPQVVTVTSGGLATSGTTARRWRRGGDPAHHILDPRTGAPADSPFSAATVAAATCVDANIASTAAMVLGASAVAWLAGRRLPARLVGRDGTVTKVAGWPAGDGAGC